MPVDHLKISLLVYLLSCFTINAFSQNVNVIFVNKTNKTIDSLEANGVFIGHIKPDSSSKVATFKALQLESSCVINGEGLLDKKRVKAWPDSEFCGTYSRGPVTEGNFLFYIKSVYIDSIERIRFESQR